VEKIKLSGKIFSGKGGGRKFLQIPWVTQQVTAKLGFTPYTGTLNLQLSDKSTPKRKLLDNAAAMTVYPAEGYCKGKLFKAAIGTVECGVVIPEVAGYPPGIIEVIAPVNLRETLRLADGDEIAVTVIL
jgi:riboflavin kinase